MKDSQSSKKKQKNKKENNQQATKQLAIRVSQKIKKATAVFTNKRVKQTQKKETDKAVPIVEWEKSGIPKTKREKKETPTSHKTKRAVFPLSTIRTYFVKLLRVFKRLSKKYETDLSLVLIPAILLILLSTITVVNTRVQSEIAANKLRSNDTIGKVNPYPFVNSVSIPNLTAKAAIITDADSQVVLFSKNPDLRFSMASTTKIMTALVGLEYFKLNSVLTIQSTGIEGSTIGLQYGDKFYFEDLLYAMLLPSANDAAVNIAQNYPGGVESFVKKMNEKAQSLHLINTHYADPVGLDDDGDYTTVVDMSRLASYAIKNKEFTKVTATKEKIISDIYQTKQYDLQNLNKLLGIDGVTGIKTGTTEGAGEVLVTSTVANGHPFIIVVMNSTDRFTDTKELLGIINKNVQYMMPSVPGENQ